MGDLFACAYPDHQLVSWLMTDEAPLMLLLSLSFICPFPSLQAETASTQHLGFMRTRILQVLNVLLLL